MDRYGKFPSKYGKCPPQRVKFPLKLRLSYQVLFLHFWLITKCVFQIFFPPSSFLNTEQGFPPFFSKLRVFAPFFHPRQQSCSRGAADTAVAAGAVATAEEKMGRKPLTLRRKRGKPLIQKLKKSWISCRKTPSPDPLALTPTPHPPIP